VLQRPNGHDLTRRPATQSGEAGAPLEPAVGTTENQIRADEIRILQRATCTAARAMRWVVAGFASLSVADDAQLEAGQGVSAIV